ncbi:MAG: T9SS type A sorting domain-containing protein [Bacteroidetes bacterium]|nr:T9SS type A sorting domain-containing protein [Bacteroidota bacterium]
MKSIKKLAFLLLIAMLAGICGPVQGRTMPPGNPLDTLYPPLNFAGTGIEYAAWLHWQKPQKPDGTTPAGLVGYYMYRGGILIAYINTPDSLFYFDFNIWYGTFSYTLKANYDLTYYGSPGQFGTSPPVGPVVIGIYCSCPLPMFEHWDQGTFAFNDWRFVPGQSNWNIQLSQGNPAPTAAFKGSPGLRNYDITLKSTIRDSHPWLCANMYLDFDYQLSDISANGTELLTAGYFNDSGWHPVYQISNHGTTGWIHEKIDISVAMGPGIQVGFKVSGNNSSNIEKWSIDNIKVYPVCKGPLGCDHTQSGKVVHLFWQKPDCDSVQVVIGYNVYRSPGLPAPFAKLNASPLAALEYFDNLPANDTCSKYYYYITALHHDLVTNTFLCEAPCDTMPVDLKMGIETLGNNRILVFPNPATDLLTVQSNTAVESAELINFTGQRILVMNAGMKTEFSIPVSAIPSGIYSIRIKNLAGTTLKKITVLH